MSKILVTGGLGFIGHNVVQLLEKSGHRVVILDNQTTYGVIPQAELDYIMLERLCKIQTRDIALTSIEQALDASLFDGVDTVIHLASFPRQKIVNSDPTRGSRVMSEGLLNLLELSVRHQVRKFVYVSSSMVYGNFKDFYFDGVDESHECNPLGQYGIMKLAGEWLVKDYGRRTGLTYTIVRPSAVYGPLDVEDRVVSKFLLTAMRGETIQVNGSNELLDFTHVNDTADGIANAALSDNSDNMTYNITRGISRTLLEAAELAVKIVGQGNIQINARDNSFPIRGQLNITRACSDFGFMPAINIEEGFEEYFDWLEHSLYWVKKTV